MTTEMPATHSPDAAAFDLFGVPEGYYAAPHPWFRLLRDHDPVHRNADGSILLTRYADVRTVWRDTTGSVNKTEQFRKKFGEGPLLEHHTTTMLFRDPPDHDRLRTAINPFFAPRSVERFRPFLEELVAELLDEVEAKRDFDLVSEFAARIPIALITRILGVPAEDGEYLRATGSKVLFPLNPRVDDTAVAAGHQATADFKAYLAEHLERAKRTSGEDRPPNTVLEALAWAGEQRGEVSDAEIIHTCLLVLNGGHETTTNLIAGSVGALVDHPEQAQDLRDHAEEILPGAMEECLRFVTPLQLQGRRTTQEVALPSGEELPIGTEVVLCQASANRDERVFDAPDELDVRRKPNAHVSFGLGVHVCAGRPLARLEAAVAVPQVLRRFPGLRRTADPVWNENVRFRGMRSMPVSIG